MDRGQIPRAGRKEQKRKGDEREGKERKKSSFVLSVRRSVLGSTAFLQSARDEGWTAAVLKPVPVGPVGWGPVGGDSGGWGCWVHRGVD